MMSYTMVGTRDLHRAQVFYDKIFAAMGLDRCWSDESMCCWGVADDNRVPRFFVCIPFDGNPATVGNGSMTAFRIGSPDEIRKLYDISIELGASCEGPPGPRPQYSEMFFGAYLRDLDGNKIAFVQF